MVGTAILSNINPALLEYSRWIWGFLALFQGAAGCMACGRAGGFGRRLQAALFLPTWAVLPAACLSLACPSSVREMGILGTADGWQPSSDNEGELAQTALICVMVLDP